MALGHGSFTGIRIGIATVKAIAQVFELPLIGVSSLETLCYASPMNHITCSLIDAKNDQVYCGLFDKNATPLENYLADDIHTVIQTLKKYHAITFIGNGADLHKVLLKETFPDCTIVPDVLQSAVNQGKCAYHKWLIQSNEENAHTPAASSAIKTADTLLPLYLRKSQAERLRTEHGN